MILHAEGSSDTVTAHCMQTTLDGLTLLRFAHMERHPDYGGTEQYLDRLNGGLLDRFNMTILQTYDVSGEAEAPLQIEHRRRGQLIWVPVLVTRVPRSRLAHPDYLRSAWQEWIAGIPTRERGWIPTSKAEMARLVWGIARYLKRRCVFSVKRVVDSLRRYRVNLLISHWLDYDVEPLVWEARRLGVPYAFVNHFENSRFATRAMARHLPAAAGLGGISGLGLPKATGQRYVNLSDGIDTDFFFPEQNRAPSLLDMPVVLLVARIAPGKGHLDALQAIRLLKDQSLDVRLVFAGPVEDPDCEAELRHRIASLGVADRVTFAGRLDRTVLKEWYVRSQVVILPSYSEGLGRVLLEAQAMERPVVAYDTGGVREAVVHGVTGYLAGVGDIRALADYIRCLIIDPHHGESVGHAGREFVVRTFGMDSFLDRHASFILACVGGNNLPSQPAPFADPAIPPVVSAE